MNSNSRPLVSVIIPCYNYGGYLPATLRQVQAQDYEEWECIVVNDGSADDTERVVQEFAAADPRIRYVWQSNQGLSAARNTGIGNSKGGYIQLLDADDGIHHEKLGKQIGYLLEHADADLVFGDAFYFHSNAPDEQLATRGGDRIKHQRLKKTSCDDELLASLCINNIMEVSSPLLRRDLVEKIGGFDASYTSFEDWQYWIRCAARGACFHYWPQRGTETFIRFGHASMMTHRERMNENGMRVRRFMMPLLPQEWKWYNRYRMLKLKAKKVWLSLQT